VNIEGYRAIVQRLHVLWAEANDESCLNDDAKSEHLGRLAEAVHRADLDVRAALSNVRRKK
jgi:hypothetical protein